MQIFQLTFINLTTPKHRGENLIHFLSGNLFQVSRKATAPDCYPLEVRHYSVTLYLSLETRIIHN